MPEGEFAEQGLPPVGQTLGSLREPALHYVIAQIEPPQHKAYTGQLTAQVKGFRGAR